MKPAGTRTPAATPLPSSVKSHISAIATVFASASGRSGNSRAISCGALQVELLGVEAQPLAVLHLLAGADAEQHVVRLVVLAAQVVRVVGGDERASPLVARSLSSAWFTRRCSLEAVVHQLQVEAVAGRRSRRTRPACARAASSAPWPGVPASSLDRQPDSPIRPWLCLASTSLSMRGRW